MKDEVDIMVKNEEEVLKMFGEGFDCSQIVLSNFCDKLNISKEEAFKIASCFGGGMWHGETCGCVCGALVALGIKYGNCTANDKVTKDELLRLKAEFESAFVKENGSCICKEILGYDLSKEDEMAKIQEEKLLETKCPKLVLSSCKILEKML